MLTNETIQAKLQEVFPGITNWTTDYGMLAFDAPAEHNLSILNFLYNDPQLRFKFLTDLTAIHFPDRKDEELCVVYHVHNWEDNVRLRFKVYIPIQSPNIQSATALYAAANWLERECYDFFGVNFLGHPDLRRIMNVEEMDYFPLRKEYPMEDPTRIDKDDEMFGRGGSF